MEKTELIQNLRAKIGEDDCRIISDKTFDGIAESVLPLFADDAKITDETWKLPVAALVQFAGQKRFDNKNFAEQFKTDYANQHEKDVEERIRKATEEAIENYKKEHPEQKTVVEEPKAEQAATSTEDIVKAVLASLNSDDGAIGKLSKQFNDYVAHQTEREKVNTKVRVKAELRDYLVSQKAKNDACIDDALDDIDYGDDPKFEELKQSAVAAYEKRFKRYYSDGGKPFGGDSTGEKDSGSVLLKSHIDRVAAKAKDAQDYADSIVFAK